MEFDIYQDKPPSTRNLLYNQVKEQSDVCDVTIRCGLWEKKFHWCVLFASPFFENIRRHSYQERESGIISMAIGTPVNIEEAILFLYGRRPEMNSTNIAGLIELAEYLIMPEMKKLCVQWIDSAKVTDETCMTMIKLSSLYEFPLPTYENYLRGRLAELIHTDDMMDLDEESVVDILDGTNIASYVKASDLFTFIVRWIRCRQSRKLLFEKMMGLVDFRDIGMSFVTDVIMKEPLVQDLDASSSFFRKLETVDSPDFCDVLIFPDKYVDYKLPCFDINTRKWCTLNTKVGDGWSEIPYNRTARCISSVRGKDHPEVYLHGETNYTGTCEIYVLNLEDNVVIQLEVNEDDQEDEATSEEVAKFFVRRDDLIIVCKQQVELDKQEHGPEERAAVPLELYLSNHPLDRMVASAAMNPHLGKKKRQQVSVLKIGKIENGATTIAPVLSIKCGVSCICANETTVMMLQDDARIMYLYNKENCSFEAIDLKEKKLDLSRWCEFAEVNDGFVIHNQTHFITVTKQIGPCLSSQYLIKQCEFGPKKSTGYFTDTYYYCENMWYRYYRDPPTFQSRTHARLLAAIQGPTENHDDIWEDIPAFGTQYGKSDFFGPRIFQVRVPKERLSCALNCPHCEQKKESERGTSNDERFALYDDDYVFYSDSDDDDSDDDDSDDDDYGYYYESDW